MFDSWDEEIYKSVDAISLSLSLTTLYFSVGFE